MLPILYYNELSSPSLKVKIAIFEKGLECEMKTVDLFNGEQYEDWFLKLNPKGQVPVFVRTNENNEVVAISESTDILKYLDMNYESKVRLFNETSDKEEEFQKFMDSFGTFNLTYALFCNHTEMTHFTNELRYPYSEMVPSLPDVKHFITYKIPQFLSRTALKYEPDSPVRVALVGRSKGLSETIQLLNNPSLYEDKVLSKLEQFLDDVDATLSGENHFGPYLFGIAFKAVDITLTCLLFRIYQLGLNKYLFGDNQRIHVRLYFETVMKRSSVIQATEGLRSHSSKIYTIPTQHDWNSKCYLGLMGIGIISGFTLYKILKK